MFSMTFVHACVCSRAVKHQHSIISCSSSAKRTIEHLYICPAWAASSSDLPSAKTAISWRTRRPPVCTCSAAARTAHGTAAVALWRSHKQQQAEDSAGEHGHMDDRSDTTQTVRARRGILPTCHGASRGVLLFMQRCRPAASCPSSSWCCSTLPVSDAAFKFCWEDRTGKKYIHQI